MNVIKEVFDFAKNLPSAPLATKVCMAPVVSTTVVSGLAGGFAGAAAFGIASLAVVMFVDKSEKARKQAASVTSRNAELS